MGCGSPWNLNVHHVRYPDRIEDTEVNDVMPLCGDCHHLIHRLREMLPVCVRSSDCEAKRKMIVIRLRLVDWRIRHESRAGRQARLLGHEVRKHTVKRIVNRIRRKSKTKFGAIGELCVR